VTKYDKAKNTVMKLNSLEVLCPNCRLSDLCLPYGLQENEVKRLAAIVKNKRPLQTNDLLYRQGNECQNLYVVKSGSFRSFITNQDGNEQTMGFHLPGEIIGFDALNLERFTCSTVALETGSVCELTFSSLNDICSQIPSLQIQMLRLAGKEIASGHDLIVLLRHHSAKERMAVFFLSLSCRYGALGFSSTEFNLSMPRHDMANFLGLTTETVSCQLAHLGKLGVITVKQRSVKINDPELLKAIVEPCSAK
jgi:CRP/FNR family transcriptional regulator